MTFVDVGAKTQGGAELDVSQGMNHILAKHREIVLIVEYRVPHLQRMGISPTEWFGRFFTRDSALFAFDDQTGARRPTAEEHARKLPSTNVAFDRLDTNSWTILKQHEL